MGASFLSKFLGVSFNVTSVFFNKTKYAPSPVIIKIFVNPVIYVVRKGWSGEILQGLKVVISEAQFVGKKYFHSGHLMIVGVWLLI